MAVKSDLSDSDLRKLSSFFDAEYRKEKDEQKKYGSVSQGTAGAEATLKLYVETVLSDGRQVFLKGGQHPLLSHEASVLRDLQQELVNKSEAQFFNFPLWDGRTKEGHYLMVFWKLGKALTLEHFKDPTVLDSVLQILEILKDLGYSQGDLKPDSFRYFYEEGSAARSIVMVDFDRARNKTRVPQVQVPADHYKATKGEEFCGQFMATPRFGSLLQHLGFLSSPCTDLEQLGLIVLTASFPEAALWSGFRKKLTKERDRVALTGKLKFLIMAQCAELLTFKFRHRPTEDPLQILHEWTASPEHRKSQDAAELSGTGWLRDEEDGEEEDAAVDQDTGLSESGAGGSDSGASREAETGVGRASEPPGVGRQAAAGSFNLPEESKRLFASTFTFAMDQLSDDEPAAYSAYAGVLRKFRQEFLRPLPESPEAERRELTGSRKAASPVFATGVKEIGTWMSRAYSSIVQLATPTPQKSPKPRSGSGRGSETSPGKLVEKRVRHLLRDAGLVEDARDASGKHRIVVAPDLSRVFVQQDKQDGGVAAGGRVTGAKGKEKTTEVDWLGRWGEAALTAGGHLDTKRDGRVLLKKLVLSLDEFDLSDWATTVEFPVTSQTRVLVEEGLGSKGHMLRKVSQSDYKAAVLLHQLADTINPLAFVQVDLLSISMLKSPTAGAVHAALKILEQSGSTRHPYLQVLSWLERAFVGIPYDLHIDHASYTHSVETSLASTEVQRSVEYEKLQKEVVNLGVALATSVVIFSAMFGGLVYYILTLSRPK